MIYTDMKKAILFTLAFFLVALSWAQEMNFQISINTPKLQTTDPKVFESLEETMKEFLNNQRWGEDAFEPDERINCNIQLTIKEELASNNFSADLAIQSSRPIFGSTSETVLLSHVDKDVTFTYEQFQPLEYSENSYNNNLTAILSFYVYVILGMDYDSFSLFGGEQYYQNANNILTSVPPSAASRFPGWRSLDGGRNRYWIIENILSPKVRPYRQAMYDYHRLSMDIMHDNPAAGRAIMTQAIEAIGKVNRSYPNSMIIQMFTNAKSQEVIEIYKNGTREEKSKVSQLMRKMDAANASKYRAIGR